MANPQRFLACHRRKVRPVAHPPEAALRPGRQGRRPKGRNCPHPKLSRDLPTTADATPPAEGRCRSALEDWVLLGKDRWRRPKNYSARRSLTTRRGRDLTMAARTPPPREGRTASFTTVSTPSDPSRATARNLAIPSCGPDARRKRHEPRRGAEPAVARRLARATQRVAIVLLADQFPSACPEKPLRPTVSVRAPAKSCSNAKHAFERFRSLGAARAPTGCSTGLPVENCIVRALADIGKTTHVVSSISYSSNRARVPLGTRNKLCLPG